MMVENIEKEIEQLKLEYQKFESGNVSAGTRARKVLQNIRNIAQELRVQILEARKK